LLLAIEANSKHPAAHNELGIVYRHTGRFTEARASYETALTIYPGYHYARRNLAVLCDLYLSDPGCALENYEAYMTTVPSDDNTSIWIADIRARLGQAVK
jgi:lipoprotein NlpI